MKSARTDRGSVRQCVLTIPLTKAEKEAVQRSADKVGITMSSFARMAIKKNLTEGKKE